MRVDILETQLFCRYFSDAIGKSDLLPVKGVSTDSRDIKKGDLCKYLANPDLYKKAMDR